MYSYNLLYAFHSLLNFQIFKQILIKRLKNIFDIFNIVENGFTKSKKCKTKKRKKRETEYNKNYSASSVEN